MINLARVVEASRRVWRSAASFARAHRLLATLITLALLYGGYELYGSLTAAPKVTHYVTTTVAIGTVVASLSETGQVSATHQIEIDSKAAGEVLSLLVTPGEHVAVGAALAYLDSTTAQQGVTSARQALEAAQIALKKQAAPTAAPDTAYANVQSAATDLNTVVQGLDTILHGYAVPGQLEFQNEIAYRNLASASAVGSQESAAESAYLAADLAYQKFKDDAGATSRSASDTSLASLVQEAYDTSTKAAAAAQATHTYLLDVQTKLKDDDAPLPSVLSGQLSLAASYLTTGNGDIATLASDRSTGVGSALDLESSQLSLAEKQSALNEAQQTLADTVVRAPFAGTVGSVAVEQYETIGNGTAVTTIISDTEGVDISVNEVDAAKLSVGQKATVTFDALPDVTLAGTVASVNKVGTAAQGVVSYGATVTFDTLNSAVLPGMSATVDIVTGTATGLTVPTSAVKTVGGQSVVQLFSPPLTGSGGASGAPSATPPTNVPVTLGLAGDTDVIIESGLMAGAQVVTKTVAGTSASTASASAPSGGALLFGGSRSGTSGGGATRALGR